MQPADFEAQMFGPQRDFFTAADRTKIARTSRRAGKSTVVAGKLLSGLQGRPGRHSLYLTLTRKNAKRILWPAAIALLQTLGVGFTYSLTELEIRLNAGGTLILGGVDTQEQVERWRGDKYQDAAVDECQSFPSDRLQSLREDVLRPALSDYRGDLLMTGTPGPVPAGYWYDLSNDQQQRYRVHHWTALDNPHIPHWAEELAEIRDENGWDENNPTYRREYLGEWVLDLDVLIYPFEDRNVVESLPLTTDGGAHVDPAQWRYVLVVDVGQVHATGFVVVAAHPAVSEDYIVHAEKMWGMTTDRMASRIIDLMTLFPGPVLMDTQGIGKRHADEVRDRYGLPIIAADKADKHSGIRLVRDRLRTSQIRALRGAADPLLHEWRTLIWNKDRNDHQREQEDHCADCAIYGIKYLRNYTTDHKSKGPEPQSAEWYRQQEDELWAAQERRMRHGRRRRSGR